MIFIRKFWKICDAFFPFSISGWMCFSSDMFFPKDALYESRDHGEAIEKRPKHSDCRKCSNEVDKVGNLLEKAIYLLNHKFPLLKQNFQLYLLRLVTSNNQNTLVFFSMASPWSLLSYKPSFVKNRSLEKHTHPEIEKGKKASRIFQIHHTRFMNTLYTRRKRGYQ